MQVSKQISSQECVQDETFGCLDENTAMLRHLVGDSASKGTLLTYYLDSIFQIF